MKKHKNQPGKRSLKRSFLVNYLAIISLLLAVTTISLLNMDFVMNRVFVKTPDFKHLDPNELYGPQGTLDGQRPNTYGGWLELVDESGKVIAIQGEKLDDITSYSDGQLYAKMDTYRVDDSIAYHAYPVAGPNGEPYLLLWKIPEPLGEMVTALGIFVATFIVLLFFALYFFTRFSVRQMKKPLLQIVEGIQEMKQFHYEKRLDFFTVKEFAEIRNAFNEMAERLQLASADKEAVEKNKQNLLLHLSHDLKTPITSILGYSQLLLDSHQLDESQKRKYVQYIYDKSSYISKLIQDLFELAKLDDHHLKLDLKKVNLTKWYQQKIAEYYPEIEHKGFSLQVDIPETPLYVMMDLVHMNRVVANLIGNALKYNPAGTELYVSCEGLDGRVVLWLGDNGVGFQEQDMEHLFEEFVRGASPVKDGTGLGLAICKKIIARHQGAIDLLIHQPYSTLFRISLPCAEEDRMDMAKTNTRYSSMFFIK
ncbi:HAMP domain-containing sensor histidine kinase [Paenibacillus sp. FSL H7-0331]|uniref:HAMP domain-containing sensor histidine kinase n=1 Tax=Paenibacillus sp. FSL H7-0331 TaxID=1920421 RepID=UPI00096E17A7|nr:HAMP domain-containing sensor histidine kinase [Paenibacillus sp. FSL H7-0331]OMF06100.1 two-component sensor histidine kinase [Paenibacillus sp. FSL H7-0331]